jgi:PhzF family phenazine biosynthesis protein
MPLEIVQVDAFTDRPFAGNPAAVCVLEALPADAWMQAVAHEMNLSETAFLAPEGDGWRLRWFTPAVEVDLCGHATLASAHVLWESGRLGLDAAARFATRSGPLSAVRRDGWIELDFPTLPATRGPLPANLLGALGAPGQPVWTGRSRYDALVELESEAVIRALRPDFTRLAKAGMRGVIVTARAERPDVDFVSRFFAPGSGVDEDPVTGSAHCVLAPHWAVRLGRSELRARQVSARGGELRVRLAGERTHIAGQAVTVLRGALADAAAVGGPV